MLDKFQELEFIERIPLVRKQKVPIGINAECPLCMEGSSKGRKRRFFIITNQANRDHNYVICHNCSVSMSVRNFLKLKEPGLYSEYLEQEKKSYISKLKEGNLKQKSKTIEYGLGELKWESLPSEFIHADANMDAYLYLRKRRIPKSVVRKTFWCPEDAEHPCSGMVIFPFYAGDKIYGWQGRSIKTKFFHSHAQEGYKIYNIYNINPEETVYVFESLIDSLYTPNSIAMLGSDINKKHLETIRNPIFCFDNDRTGLNKAEKYLDKGYKVFIYPDNFLIKDINEGIIKNLFSTDDLKHIINNNVYKGFKGKTKISIKRKGMR